VVRGGCRPKYRKQTPVSPPQSSNRSRPPLIPFQPVSTAEIQTSPRLGILVEMLRALSIAETPAEVLRTFARGYWALRPIQRMVSVSTRDLPPGLYRLTRNIDVQAVLAGRFIPDGTIPPREQLPVHSGGFLGEAIADGRPKLIAELDVPDDPVLGDLLKDLRSVLVLPLFDEGEPRYWTFQFRKEPHAFTAQELEQAAIVANLVGGTNTRLLLMQQVNELNRALRAQFEDVAKVQRSLLPKRLPDIPGLQIATSYLTSDQAGGDYYDFFPFEDGTWGILIADVSGHGAAAATIMAMLHGILHTYTVTTNQRRSPDAVLRHANRRLFEAGLEGNFVTAFFAVYDPRNATLTYARSGHNPPLLKDGRTGAVSHLEGEGAPPLGLFEPYELACDTVELRPNDTVILYTDGITEAFNAAREMFGPSRLDAALVKCSGAPDCVVDSVHSSLYQHTGSRTRADDQTLVAIRFTGEA
jgi:sigma-B regulation protein RsbU (phosphoserine phosphatase)